MLGSGILLLLSYGIPFRTIFLLFFSPNGKLNGTGKERGRERERDKWAMRKSGDPFGERERDGSDGKFRKNSRIKSHSLTLDGAMQRSCERRKSRSLSLSLSSPSSSIGICRRAFFFKRIFLYDLKLLEYERRGMTSKKKDLENWIKDLLLSFLHSFPSFFFLSFLF